METILHNCCGLDIHKESVYACIIKTKVTTNTNSKKEDYDKEFRVFEAFPESLRELKNWLITENCQHVAMESTGVYWHPVYNELETSFDGNIELLVANARHLRNVRGKKTDMKDSEWIALLYRAGLLNGSFIPPQEIRDFRKLARYRKNIVSDISKQKNRIEKLLQSAGFKLSSFLSDIFGVSGRNLINVLIKNGVLSESAVDIGAKHISAEKRHEIKRLLTSQLNKHERDFLKLQIKHLDQLQAHLDSVEKSIEKHAANFKDEIERLDSIPGIAKTAATAIIAEIGVDMSKFPTVEQFCKWAGLTPGNNESAGKKKVQE